MNWKGTKKWISRFKKYYVFYLTLSFFLFFSWLPFCHLFALAPGGSPSRAWRPWIFFSPARRRLERRAVVLFLDVAKHPETTSTHRTAFRRWLIRIRRPWICSRVAWLEKYTLVTRTPNFVTVYPSDWLMRTTTTLHAASTESTAPVARSELSVRCSVIRAVAVPMSSKLLPNTMTRASGIDDTARANSCWWARSRATKNTLVQPCLRPGHHLARHHTVAQFVGAVQVSFSRNALWASKTSPRIGTSTVSSVSTIPRSARYECIELKPTTMFFKLT